MADLLLKIQLTKFCLLNVMDDHHLQYHIIMSSELSHHYKTNVTKTFND